MTSSTQTWHYVEKSTLHGNGVFAATDIPAGTEIFEYKGKRITPEQADAMYPVNPDDPFHTFFFALSCGKVIDGGQKGNDARWINHSCEPNCEAQENNSGKKVFIVALRDIAAGEELFYDYGLILAERITKTLRRQYQCLCGADSCRGTMLALTDKQKAAIKAAAKKAKKEAAPAAKEKAKKASKAPAKNKARQDAEPMAKDKLKKRKAA